jgi:hypothetical protein
MTCRQNLVLGLFVALMLPLACVRGTHAAAPIGQSTAPSDASVPDITLRRSSTTTAAGKPATWKASNHDASADIRFKKPALAAASTASIAPARNATSSIPAQSKSAGPANAPREPVNISHAARQTSVEARPSSTEPAVPNVTFASPRVATQQATTPAKTSIAATAKIEESSYPEVTQAIAAEQIEQPHQLPIEASQPRTESSPSITSEPQAAGQSRPEIRLTDEQLQLVSRILQDHQVMRAAEEEMPPAPGAAGGGENGTNGAKNHAPELDGNHAPALDGEAMYYGECCPPQPRLFWSTGIEATFLSPDLNSDGVSVTVEEIDEDRHDVCTTLSDDVDDFYVSPRIWLGVQGCCWGANLRYWHLQASEGAFDPSIGSLGTWDAFDCGTPDFGFMTCSSLEAYTIDLELTRRFCLNDCAMQAAVGLRHAEIEHSEGLWALANADEGLLTGFARANRLSRGTGLMFGLYGRKPVFPCSCVHWFYNARWSALWGPTQTSVETFASVQTIADPNISGSAASVNAAYTNVDDTLFIGEIQLGLEWDYCLQCVPANAFFRAALEYQRWDGGKGWSQSQSFAGATIVGQVDPTSVITADAAASAPQMDLIGISLATGLTW